ncbi:MAG: enoyl-CoA hydratase/isomerase family protein [Pseudomonadota bacterium]
MQDIVKYELSSKVAMITLNRPEVLNALNVTLFRQLESLLNELQKPESGVECVVIQGAGKAFSAGHDLRDIAEGDETDHGAFEAAVLEKLAELPVPVIAKVHGYCFTGALELALACDLIFIDADTVLADTHSQWGLSPIWGMTQRLPRRVGTARAKDLMFSSRRVPADEALRIGLVDYVVPSGQLDQVVKDYAQGLVKNSSHSQRISKEILATTDGLRLTEGLDYEYLHSPGACEDMEDRIAEFMASR